MATWNDVTNFIRSNYKISVDEAGHLGLLFNAGDLRTQTVHIWHQVLQDGQEEWLQIESPFGKFGEGDLVAIVREVGTIVCGAVASTGDYLVVRHSVPLENLDPNEITRPLGLVTNTADRLERMYTGRDDL